MSIIIFLTHILIYIYVQSIDLKTYIIATNNGYMQHLHIYIHTKSYIYMKSSKACTVPSVVTYIVQSKILHTYIYIYTRDTITVKCIYI